MTGAPAYTILRAILLLLTCSGTVVAQGIGLPDQSRKQPVEIHADQGIEWLQEKQTYIARGNARAQQGDVAVHADQLTAYYRKGPDGKTQIWRIDADGNVRIVSPEQTAYGKKGVYEIEKGVFVLTGAPRLVTKTDHISATGSLEFWEKRSLAVARGDALAVRADKRLRADTLTAHFVTGKDGKNQLNRVEAFDNVLISTPEEIVRAKRGVYNTITGIIILRGSVKITRGKDQLNGEAAEVNLNTGVSRLLGGGSGRVRGIFQPETKSRPPAVTITAPPEQKSQ
jgi:lipopolysaccharide export system protein LptA